MIQLMEHQQKTSDFVKRRVAVFNTSEAGTGKTIATIWPWKEYRDNGGKGRLFVSCPLSIVYPAWVADLEKVLGSFVRISVCLASTRLQGFETDADVYIFNHDGCKWLADQEKDYIRSDDWLVIDESTAFKNREAKRSKKLARLAPRFAKRILMTGTPNPNGILDLWHQIMLLDNGNSFMSSGEKDTDSSGKSYFSFRNKFCYPQQIPGTTHQQWVEKNDAVERVHKRIKHMVISFSADECLDLPKNTMQYMEVKLPDTIRKQYNKFAEESYLELKNGTIDAVHAGARARKLLQLLTGSVYDREGNPKYVHKERYKLVIDLILERKDPCIVAYNYHHEKDELFELARTSGITCNAIHGGVNANRRAEIVERFQNGNYQMLLCQPQAASHGLTLVRGKTTIWASPTYNAEHFQQLNKRIHRKGQTARTETICIAAEDTKEIDVYQKLNGKMDRMESLLEMLTKATKTRGKKQ